jgi:hypothetical protein
MRATSSGAICGGAVGTLHGASRRTLETADLDLTVDVDVDVVVDVDVDVDGDVDGDGDVDA